MFSFNTLKERFPTLALIKGQQTDISGLNQLSEAAATEATFLVDARYRSLLTQTRAGVLITNVEIFPFAKDEFAGTLWHSPDPLIFLNYVGSLIEQQRYGVDERWSEPGVHRSAIIETGATVHPLANIGPYCVIRSGAVIGQRCVLQAYVYVGTHASLEEDCVLGAGVTVLAHTHIGARTHVMPGAVMGSQGFGVLRNGDHKNTRIPQMGSVQIGPDSRVGSNATIDRGTFHATQLGARCYLDNQTQVGHNASVGDDFIMCAQSGLTGSTKVGDRVTIGALAGLKDHVEVTDDVIITGMTGVTKNCNTPNTVLKGHPAEPLQEYLRLQAALRKLPELIKRVRELEARLDELTGSTSAQRGRTGSKIEFERSL